VVALAARQVGQRDDAHDVALVVHDLISSIASPTDCSSVQHCTSPLITSETVVSSGSSPSATPRTVMSRSVIMPSSSPSWHTGSEPTSFSCISKAAWRSVSCGAIVQTSVDMMSATDSMVDPPG
jgi:hypothetical protein